MNQVLKMCNSDLLSLHMTHNLKYYWPENLKLINPDSWRLQTYKIFWNNAHASCSETLAAYWDFQVYYLDFWFYEKRVWSVLWKNTGLQSRYYKGFPYEQQKITFMWTKLGWMC